MHADVNKLFSTNLRFLYLQVSDSTGVDGSGWEGRGRPTDIHQIGETRSLRNKRYNAIVIVGQYMISSIYHG